MALDAILLRHLTEEISKKAIGAKVDKIFQPTKDELTLVLRTFNDTYKLLISANASNSRLYFTNNPTQNPKTPPMFCMLLRKKLISAKLMAVESPDLERIVFLHFDTVNELGDKIKLTLVVEIMGKYSNIILLDENNIIIDAIKRVDINTSSKRLVLPKIRYKLPQPQSKLNMLNCSVDEIISSIKNSPKEENLSKAIFSSIMGISPVVAREIASLVSIDDVSNRAVDCNIETKLKSELEKLILCTRECKGIPYVVVNKGGRPIEVSFMPIRQYGELADLKKYETFSNALDDFYYERASIERLKSKTHSLNKVISTKRDRIARKVSIQKGELAKSLKRDELKVKGDLLQANLYRLTKGLNTVKLDNFYDNMSEVEIALKCNLSPSENAQLYYKRYRKAVNAETHLTTEISKGLSEVEYLNSILDLIARAKTEEEIKEIKLELSKEGYINSQKSKRKKAKDKKLPPIEYNTTSGLKILVGRNNRQNDNLTLRKTDDNDMWFHVKNAPGSHTVLLLDNKLPNDEDIVETAKIAAKHSSFNGSSNIPVDYTKIKNVTKPNKAKPGMVIYVDYKTVYVTPEY